jgi:hypothetical protein
MYDPRNIFKQKPEDIKAVVLLVLSALVMRGTIDASGEEVALWGLIVEQLLSRFYVAPTQQARVERELIEVGKQIDKAVADAPSVVIEQAESVDVAEAAAPAGKPRSRTKPITKEK